ncbi:MAG TPA: GTP 3',8-cyclase MoaA [Bryobacteraceae bacterium]
MSELVQIVPGERPIAAWPATGPLIDQFGRIHDSLRISVTDHCNIRCFYCMPEEAADFIPPSQQLTFDQIIRFVNVAKGLGIKKLRLTGGEPLVRPDLPKLVERLCQIGFSEVALTTNAVLLERFAQPLFDAGLRRLNIHVDTLDRDRFRYITRRDDLDRVLAGIEKAIQVGFRSVKLNAVAIRDLNEPDIIPLARFARERNFEIRYIEFMPLDSQHLWSRGKVLLADEMLGMLESAFGALVPVPDADPRAPASEYRFADNGARVGIIASVSRPFCLNCNRLRLTSDGKIRYCLFAREETDAAGLLTDGDDAEIETAIRSTVWRKWSGHQINSASFAAPQRPMYSIGG